MMPFLIPSLDELMRQLMGIFIRKEVITNAKHSHQLAKIDVSKKENQLPTDSIKLPTATSCKLRSLQASDNAKLNFKVSCKQILVQILQKMIERHLIHH